MSDQPTPRSVLRGLCIDDQSADLIADRIASLKRENAALKAENAALRADAERYRWIKRDNIGVHDVLELFMSYINCDLDKEIDQIRAKEAKTCQCTNGVVRSVGRDNEEIIEDCPNCSPSKETQP